MTKLELAWAAGLFEGEGTVRINKPTKRNMGALIVSVTNTDRQIVDWFQTRWPGYMKGVSGMRPDQRPAWAWVIAAHVAAGFLTSIRPYIVRDIVLERIDHGLQFQAGKTRRACATGNRSRKYAEAQWNAYWWMCELNKRGVRKPMPIVDVSEEPTTCPQAEQHRRPR